MYINSLFNFLSNYWTIGGIAAGNKRTLEEGIN
jgi:hypothetical protein